MSEVIKLVPDEVGEDYCIDPDQVMAEHKGKLTALVLIGEDEDGDIVIAGSHNAGVSNILIDQAKQQLIARD